MRNASRSRPVSPRSGAALQPSLGSPSWMPVSPKRTCRLIRQLGIGVRRAGDERCVVQPDIVVVCDRSKIDDRGCRGARDSIIEILSPGTREKDSTPKRDLYFRYWKESARRSDDHLSPLPARSRCARMGAALPAGGPGITSGGTWLCALSTTASIGAAANIRAAATLGGIATFDRFASLAAVRRSRRRVACAARGGLAGHPRLGGSGRLRSGTPSDPLIRASPTCALRTRPRRTGGPCGLDPP